MIEAASVTVHVDGKSLLMRSAGPRLIDLPQQRVMTDLQHVPPHGRASSDNMSRSLAALDLDNKGQEKELVEQRSGRAFRRSVHPLSQPQTSIALPAVSAAHWPPPPQIRLFLVKGQNKVQLVIPELYRRPHRRSSGSLSRPAIMSHTQIQSF